MKVADFSIARFDQRRNHNWRVSLGFWAAILGSATLLGSGNHPVALYLQIVGACIVLCLHTYWLWKVFKGDQKDKILAFDARDIAIGLLKTKLKSPPFTVKSEKAFKDWSVLFQFATTLVLLVAILLIVNSRVIPPPP
jgi:hypothetical protein